MDNRKLHGRVALITGASRGIGRAIARGYAKEGAVIAITARTEADLHSLVEEAQAAGGKALAIRADLVDLAALAQVVRQVLDAFGTIDILVNNAGIGSSSSPRPVVDFDDEFWNKTLALNLTAPYNYPKLFFQSCSRRSGVG
jgi:NAD(P)-dependent dehydrogenase (short-subunit alcohol dehydrogenase family)